jgi:DNA polymerase-3 subunit beta
MQFIVSSTLLLKHLQSISGVLSTNNTLPILDNFLFSIEGKQLTVLASDLETTISSRFEIEAKEDGAVAIPAKFLMDALKTFSEQPLTFSVDMSNFGIEISSDNGKFKLSGQNKDEFPNTPVLESPSSMTLSSDVLSRAITKTIFATGNDDLRPVMSGVFFQLESDSVTFAATDAHKLVRYRSTSSQASSTTSFIVPKKPLNLLKNLVGNTTDDVTLEYSESNVHFKFDDFNVVCRLIDGKYPNYDAVIPKTNPNRLTVERQSLLNSMKRVSIFSNKSTHQVRLKVAGSELAISAEDLDFANAANERLTCSYEGTDMEIGFNSRFLIEMLSNLESDNIHLEMSDPSRAGIILPSETDIEGEDILMLVMPVMLNN